MRTYQIKIKTANGTQTISGLFASTFDAMDEGLRIAGTDQCAVSAKVAK